MIKTCNICWWDVELLTAEQLYWEKYSHLKSYHYRCTKCSATVGCHWKTKNPFWILADKKTKFARHKCHELLDPLWKCEKDWDFKSWSRWRKRRYFYKMISRHLNIPIEDTHFGMFTIEQCREAYLFILKYKAKPRRII